MHYRNGREAKNGDKIVQLAGGKITAAGVLYDATPGNDYCNGNIALTLSCGDGALAPVPHERCVRRWPNHLETTMATLIMHKDGAYNLYGTIADGPHLESALTLEQLTEVIRQEHGEAGLRELPQRLERAHRTGCSHTEGWTLEDCIAGNRAGPNETSMSYEDFVARYLTLAPNADSGNGRVYVRLLAH